jgi:hypothetical protein
MSAQDKLLASPTTGEGLLLEGFVVQGLGFKGEAYMGI